MTKDSVAVEEGGEVVGVAGAGMVMECRAEGGNPPPALRWTMGGVRQKGEEEVDPRSGVMVSRVVLEVTRAEQGREVSCEVVHPAVHPSTMTARANLHVHCEFQHILTSQTHLHLNFNALTSYHYHLH